MEGVERQGKEGSKEGRKKSKRMRSRKEATNKQAGSPTGSWSCQPYENRVNFKLEAVSPGFCYVSVTCPQSAISYLSGALFLHL